MQEKPLEAWTSGDLYERYGGRWGRKVAELFLAWLAINPRASWGDVGCGTGALIETILSQYAPASVSGIDKSQGYISHAQKNIKDARVRLDVGDAMNLPWDAAAFDATVCGLVLNFLPDAGATVREMVRVTKRSGKVGAYVWDYQGGMQMMYHFWSAATALFPEAAKLDQGERFPLCQPGPLAKLFVDAGLDCVEVRAIEIDTVFRDFDDYWTPFLGGQGSAPSYVATLDTQARDRLRDVLKAQLPVNADGSIHLMAKAWAVKGTVPG